MENLKSIFGNIGGQFSKFWGTLNGPKKMMVVGGVLSVIIGVIVVIALERSSDYEYLFVNLSPEDSAEIVGYMKKSNVADFIVDSKGIKVPADQLLDLRIKLTQEGMPSQGLVGWEKFDNPDFTRTEFEQQIQKIRAIQGELSRTIMNIEGVSSARVHIVVPKQALFAEDKQETTAAVYIKNKRGKELDGRQIRGIVHLVSRSVEGLNPDNIVIIDYEGKMLTDEKSKDPGVRQTKEMLEHRKSIEKNLEEKIRAIVGRVVSPDRVEAKVDVTLDYTQEEQTISDIDPDRTVVIASATNNMTLEGTGLNPTGIPGSKSNVPGEQESLSQATSRTNNSKTGERINYEVAKKVSRKILPTGTITRISAAVLVDGKQPYPIDGTVPAFEPRTPEEMKKIEELVKGAIGFSETRGDHVEVDNMLFQLDQVQVQAIAEQKKENRGYIATLGVSALVALALLFFFAFIVRPYFRWLSYDPERRKQEAIIEEFKPDLELGSIQHVQVKEEVPFDKLTPTEQVMYLAKHEPMRTTEAIRIMLNPHQGLAK